MKNTLLAILMAGAVWLIPGHHVLCLASGEGITNALPDPGNLVSYRGRTNEVFYFTVTGSASAGSIWGTDIYTDDSTLAKAAVHAGILTNGQTGIIKVIILPSRSGYISITRNGITSSSYGGWTGSYAVDAAIPATDPPQITLQPQSQTVPAGAGITLTVLATGSVPLRYQWQFNGVNIPQVFDSTLTLKNMTFGQSGGYSLIVTNSLGSVTSQVATVTVITNVPPIVSVTAPADGTVFTEPASIPIAATASDFGGAVEKVEFLWGDLVCGQSMAAPYQFTWEQIGAGIYSIRARATDSSGATTTSMPVNITVQPPLNPITNGIPDPGNLASYRGRFGQVFYFKVTGNSTPGSIWGTDIYTDDSNLARAAAHAGLLTNGQTGIIKVTILAGQSSYQSTTRNGMTSSSYGGFAGSYSVAPTIPITNPPQMALQPRSQTIPAGASVTFTARGVGSVPLYYQWQFNGINMSQALDTTLTLNNLNFAQAGSYTVLVTNAAGAVISQAAILTVITNTPPTVALASPASGATFFELDSIPLVAAAEDPDGAVTKVEFYWENARLGEAAAVPYEYNLQNAGAGTWTLTAKATDTSGATTTSAPIAITVLPPQNIITNPLPNPGNLTGYRGRTGQVFYFAVTGNTSAGSIWGTDIYTDDSRLAAAVVHAGVLTNGQTGCVRVAILPGQSSYLSSNRNGVTSSSYGAWGGSYSVRPVTLVRLQPLFVMNQTYRLASGAFHLTVDPAIGPNHVIENSTNLAQWTPLTNIPNPTVRFQVDDPGATNSPAGFYRIRLTP